MAELYIYKKTNLRSKFIFCYALYGMLWRSGSILSVEKMGTTQGKRPVHKWSEAYDSSKSRKLQGVEGEGGSEKAFLLERKR